MSVLIGQSLGPYKILAELGHGGMASVYLAEQPSVGRLVAIKVLPTHNVQDRTFLERFRREVKVIASLQHPRILAVYDFDDAGGVPYIVMAYLPGGTLAEHIKEAPGGMALDETMRMVEQMAEGLDYAHREGVIHRDFKPSNVLLDKDGNLHLADFGIAKVTAETSQLTGSGMIGTPHYMAPEMSDPDGLSPLVDIYALGVTLFQMLTGRYPYEAPTPIGVLLAHANKPIPDAREFRQDLPDAGQAVIERAMAKKPADRYQSAGETAAALRAAILEASVDEPETVATNPPRQATRKVSLPLIAAGVMVLIAGVIGGIVLLSGEGEKEGVANIPTRTEAIQTANLTPRPTEAQVTANEATTGVITPTLSGERLRALAEAGISRNGEWAPHIEALNEVKMALVPKGCFLMGSDHGLDDEKPVHQICFDKPFWIDRTEVTNTQFAQFGGQAKQSSNWTGGDRPRESISWAESDGFCRKRDARLPSEAEWEYAARGPDGLTYPWGNAFIADNVVYATNSGGQSWDAGSKPGGASWVGALDMVGNVTEWVNDWYRPYSSELQTNPTGPDSGQYRALRGGDFWSADPSLLRATYRNWFNPDGRLLSFGFRCVRNY